MQSQIIDALETEEDVKAFAKICKGLGQVPDGVPGAVDVEDGFAQFHVRRRWHRYLSKLTLSWEQASGVAERWRTALAPPHNPWFLDLPIEWVPALLDALPNGLIESAGNHDVQVKHPYQAESWIRFKGAPKGGTRPRWTNCNQNRFLRSVKFQRLVSTSNLRSRFLRMPFPRVGH